MTGASPHDRGPAGGAVGGAGQAGHVGGGRSPAGAHAERLPAVRHGVLQGSAAVTLHCTADSFTCPS